jgi:hypothetical protein
MPNVALSSTPLAPGIVSMVGNPEVGRNHGTLANPSLVGKDRTILPSRRIFPGQAMLFSRYASGLTATGTGANRAHLGSD